MAALVCDLCGGKLIMGAGEIATCDSCGMEHSANRMKEKVQEIKGVVQIDNTHLLDNYLQMAKNASSSSNHVEAEAYCNKIIEIDPENYEAWYIKGMSAGWQSTLANLRIDEATNAFAKSILNAPEQEKESIIEAVKEQIQNLCAAALSLQADRFKKWPDEEETTATVAIMTSSLSLVLLLLKQTGVIVSIGEIMSSAAKIIDEAVSEAYKNVIYPEYKSQKYPYPDDDDWRKYIVRVGYCWILIEKAIKMTGEDNFENIQRYEQMIYYKNCVVNSCSYISDYFDFHPEHGTAFVKNIEEILKAKGLIPDSRNSRVYGKNLKLNSDTVDEYKKEITSHNNKIAAIKAAKAAKEAAEKAEKERIAREEAQKRFDDYWAEHADEKVALEAEKNGLNSQISALNTSLNDQVSALNKEISSIPGKAEIDNIDAHVKKLTEEKSSLGLFKGKEKKALQEQIDQANTEKKAIQNRMDAAKKEIESKISIIKSDFQKKISPLQRRVNEISNELTKAR